jgi:hypothetical protein
MLMRKVVFGSFAVRPGQLGPQGLLRSQSFLDRTERFSFSVKLSALAAVVGMAFLVAASPARALTATGMAVGAVGSNTQVGLLADRPLLDVGIFEDQKAIKYYIPLKDSGGTYGVGKYTCGGTGFGTCSDSGDGGGLLTMILRFSPVSKTANSTLRVIFEDLDLSGANDPVGFLERLKVQTWSAKDNKAVDLTGWIKDIGGLVTGNSSTQQILSLALGTLQTDPLYLFLQFKAQSTFNGTNTAEYLIAMVTSPDAPPGGGGEVPLPGAVALFGTVLAGSWGIGRWRRHRNRSV